MADKWMEDRGLVGRVMGYLVVRDEGGHVVCDWDGEIHQFPERADAELVAAKRDEPLYEWYVAEVRRTEANA